MMEYTHSDNYIFSHSDTSTYCMALYHPLTATYEMGALFYDILRKINSSYTYIQIKSIKGKCFYAKETCVN